MNIVLDTNVLVSGLLSPYRAPGIIVRMVSAGTLRLCYDARIFTEYDEVLRRPIFKFHTTQIDAFLDQIKTLGQLVVAKPLQKSLPDSKDQPFLEVAFSAQAKCLVTGNIKHYPADLRQKVHVMLPADFVKWYGSQS